MTDHRRYIDALIKAAPPLPGAPTVYSGPPAPYPAVEGDPITENWWWGRLGRKIHGCGCGDPQCVWNGGDGHI